MHACRLAVYESTSLCLSSAGTGLMQARTRRRTAAGGTRCLLGRTAAHCSCPRNRVPTATGFSLTATLARLVEFRGFSPPLRKDLRMMRIGFLRVQLLFAEANNVLSEILKRGKLLFILLSSMLYFQYLLFCFLPMPFPHRMPYFSIYFTRLRAADQKLNIESLDIDFLSLIFSCVLKIYFKEDDNAYHKNPPWKFIHYKGTKWAQGLTRSIILLTVGLSPWSVWFHNLTVIRKRSNYSHFIKLYIRYFFPLIRVSVFHACVPTTLST